MQLIHVECLKQWLNGKIHQKETYFTNSYNWKFLECELCKSRFKDSYTYKGKVFSLLNYLNPSEGHYIVLESFTNTPHKTIHVVRISESEALTGKKEKSFFVGRGNTVDIRITDISVSRVHSEIKLVNGEFYLNDKDAKFGTLVLI